MASTKNLATAKVATSVFTDVGGRLFLRLWLPIAAVAFDLLLLLALVQAIRRKALGRPMLIAAGATIGGIAASALVGIGAGFLRAGDFWRAYPLVTYLAIYAILLLAMVAIWRRWGVQLEVWRMRAAAWLLILLVGGIASIFLPGAIIYFLIAPAIAVAGIMLAGRAPRVANALTLSAVFVQFLMLGQLLALIELLLIDGPIYAVAPLAALAALPIIVELAAHDLKPALRILAIGAFGFWAAALLMPRASAERPAAFTIDYFRDDSAGQTHWAVASKQAPLPAAFPGTWRKDVLAYSTRTRWASQAPLIEVPRPDLRLVRSEPVGKGRRVWLVLSPGGANAVAIRFAEGTALQRLGMPAATLPMPAKGEPEKALLRCSGRSCEGYVVEALLADRRPVIADLFATRFALPEEGKPFAARRPANAHPQYGPDSSIRMRTIRF